MIWRKSRITSTGLSPVETPEKLRHGAPGRLVGLGKESGELEFAADTVLVLTQEPWENDTPPRGGTVCHLALAKVRAGTPASHRETQVGTRMMFRLTEKGGRHHEMPAHHILVEYRAHSRFPGHALTPTGVMAIRCKQFHLPDL